MAQIRVGILGGGWPGGRHLEGYKAAGGFEIAAVADLIPARRKAILQQAPAAREYADASQAVLDPQIDAVSVCLPNHLHWPVMLAALKAGKHVICEPPPVMNAGEAKKLATAAAKAGKVFLYAAQRRFGGGELAARQAVEKGYLGDVRHVRVRWMRTRGIPTGTGWYGDRSKSGGGALIDLGLPMLDLAWHLLGQPQPTTAFGIIGRCAAHSLPDGPALSLSKGPASDVEDSAFALLRFENGKSVELAASWAINQPPRQHGTVCRLHGDQGAIDLYTPHGPVLYRSFNAKGEAKETPLKLPRVVHYHAMMRHFKDCITNGTPPQPGPVEAVILMQMIDAVYKSAETGKSGEIRG